MLGKTRFWHWVAGAAVLAAAECAVIAAIDLTVTTPAQAQYRDDRYQYWRHQRPRSGGFFEELFGGFGNRAPDRGYEQRRPQPQVQPRADYSRAPPPRKPDTAGAVSPATSIVVMGGSMADWLAYGLEDAFADSPEVAIVRKDKPSSGLIRYQSKSDADWWHVARDILSKDKANYVVIMVGVSDRQNIRERDVEAEKEAEKNEQSGQTSTQTSQGAAAKPGEKNAATTPKTKPEPKAKKSNGVIEFRTDRWAAVYSHRIDETIAALKSKGVPVFWVGLPSIRGSKSTADAVYLNDLFRSRAERDGAIYIDVWDGFVDESGKYSSFGPDYEGQIRRLRSGDGVFFTKYGARKLAHYVEREIRRYMNNRTPVALPSGPLAPVPGGAKSAARPLTGPVVPLTVPPNSAEALAGGASTPASHGDSLSAQVLVKGEAVDAPAGRADDFTWPPGSKANKPKPTAVVQPKVNAPGVTPAPRAAAPATPSVAAPVAPSAPIPPAAAAPVAAKPPAPARPTVAAKKKPAAHSRLRAERSGPRSPRPPRSIQTRQKRPPPQAQPSFPSFFGGLFGGTR